MRCQRTSVFFTLVTRAHFLTSASKFDPNDGFFDVSPQKTAARHPMFKLLLVVEACTPSHGKRRHGNAHFNTVEMSKIATWDEVKLPFGF